MKRCVTPPDPWIIQVTGSLQIPNVNSFSMKEEWVRDDGQQLMCANIVMQ